MAPFERKSSIRMKGEDVRLLHDGLEKAGHSIPSDEKEKKYFGSGTRNAVIEFQKEHGLKASGEVDKATAAKMDESSGARPVPLKTPRPEVKTGTGEFRVIGRTLRKKSKHS